MPHLDAYHFASLEHRPDRSAMDNCLAAITTAGRIDGIILRKGRARVYLDNPAQLETIARGLSDACPVEGIARLRSLIAETASSYRTVGGVIPRINLRAAELAFRVLRRRQRHVVMMEAA